MSKIFPFKIPFLKRLNFNFSYNRDSSPNKRIPLARDSLDRILTKNLVQINGIYTKI